MKSTDSDFIQKKCDQVIEVTKCLDDFTERRAVVNTLISNEISKTVTLNNIYVNSAMTLAPMEEKEYLEGLRDSYLKNAAYNLALSQICTEESQSILSETTNTDKSES